MKRVTLKAVVDQDLCIGCKVCEKVFSVSMVSFVLDYYAIRQANCQLFTFNKNQEFLRFGTTYERVRICPHEVIVLLTARRFRQDSYRTCRLSPKYSVRPLPCGELCENADEIPTAAPTCRWR